MDIRATYAADTTSVKSTASVWQQMLKTVRDVDVVRVDDCKEDIDTLLVFAGLFSAVLTAFLIESYTMLLPDPTSEMTFLLRQSLAQNYTFSAGSLNSTRPFPGDPPSFEAPAWAARVNQLWFASLVCSLATASLAMLVKQWLREYLAIEWTVPQERLRAWEYRNGALTQWKVFEIASVLPLLLQLSLGLFFAGLCVFTAEIDPRIGRPTLALVAGWAFFIVATTAAPLASPRCPYKVPLLKKAVKEGRRLGRAVHARVGLPLFYAIRSVVVDRVSPLVRTILISAHGVYVSLIIPGDLPFILLRDLVSWMQDIVTRVEGRGAITIFLSLMVVPVLSIPPLLLVIFVLPQTIALLAVLRAIMTVIIFVLLLSRPLATSTLRAAASMYTDLAFFLRTASEEENIIRKAEDDIDLLLSVDEAMVNDGFLQSMCDLVRYKHPSPDTLTVFAFGLLKHRTGASHGVPQSMDDIFQPLNLNSLSQLAWEIICEVVLEAFKRHATSWRSRDVGRQAQARPSWARVGLAILRSTSRFAHPAQLDALYSDDTLLSGALEDIAWSGGFRIHPARYIQTVTLLIGPRPHYHPSDASRLLVESLPDVLQQTSPKERGHLVLAIGADLRRWITPGQDTKPSDREGFRTYCGAVSNVVALLVHLSAEHVHEHYLQAMAHAFERVLTLDAHPLISRDVSLSLISPKLGLLLVTFSPEGYAEAFRAALASYSTMLSACLDSDRHAADANRLLSKDLPETAFTGIGPSSHVLHDLWEYFHLFAMFGPQQSTLPADVRIRFAHVCLLYIRPHLVYASAAGDDPSNPWRRLSPMLQDALAFSMQPAMSESHDTVPLIIKALQRIILHRHWYADRYPRELLEALAGTLPETEPFYDTPAMIRLRDYLRISP